MVVCDQEVYDIGDAPNLYAEFRADPYPSTNPLDGALTDPTTVVFKIKAASTGVTVTYTYGTDGNVTKPSTGLYKCSLPVRTTSDRYFVSAHATGTINAAVYGEFTVRAAP